ncbi:GTPase [Hydrocarboniclastica marina]|uniref:GTPase n=1 Tax=Hydrocarboniclastica marina TaxID=2259620 RepID=A0A4P7XIR9_9ALTE|nr:GTPase [Hydrocarboniclastica marina]MAL97536.1 GTPase [Alteromonadaceae bacterium]QCF26633.1 GTPase [Hydrocarboniclastica marina]|tara:strand:- start:1634 stop:3436 length:1803 start_codon:yes stop_codon:yes gene_type:complete
MEGNTHKLNLVMPEQSRTRLTFCEAAPKPFRSWIKGLPMANIGETARRLYQAIIELNQLEAPAPLRLSLLELIRPPIYYVCNELARHYLGHSISLPDKQRKVANLAQALQLHLASGYKQALVDFLDNNSNDRNRRQIAQSAHRAITDLSSTVLRAAQLYCPSPARSWAEAHSIFRFIHARQLDDLQIEDETNAHRPDLSLSEAYKRLLLLGCCRPNQLRQDELKQVYGLFELWANHSEFKEEPGANTLFLVDVNRDAPPVYRSLVPELPTGALNFDTTELWERLTETLNTMGDRRSTERLPLELPGAVNEALMLHLNQALGILTKRSFKRIPRQGRLQVCIGMSAAHYYSAGEVEFNQFLGGTEAAEDEANVFLTRARRKEDAWSGAHDAAPSESMVSPDVPINFRGASGNVVDGQERQASYPSYTVPLVNTSPGGYCLHWNEKVPSALQTGEVAVVREQSSHPWSLAVVRWIRQVRQQGTQVGIELLAPNSVPCGVQLIQKVGNSSEFLRGLLLPELGNLGQPATLITPRMPFQVGSRVVLFHDNSEEECQLSRRVAATGSISQFELRFFKRSEPEKASPAEGRADTTEDDFDSLWPSL